jgi:hypothetical protein
MQQRAVMHFLTLKVLNPGDVHAELILIYEADVLVLQTLYK